MAKKNLLGFTLIELLIVVAIIAILAAIAIPNFLAAQTRAKASSAKAGMRTITTGLESYYVDATDYPPARTMSGANNWMVPIELTTPIAYITSFPKDPFDRYQSSNADALRTLRYRSPGWGWDFYSGGLGTISLYVPYNFPEDELADGASAAPSDPRWYRNKSQATIKWGLWSNGPDGDFESEQGVQPCRLKSWYDPTNGIMSNGNICRFSNGFVTP